MITKANIIHSLLGIQPYPTLPTPKQKTLAPLTASKPTHATPPAPIVTHPTFSSLDELAQALKSCKSPLKHTAISFVFSAGTPSDIMLVGEAPGAEEDQKGEPFVGKSGQLLMHMFACVGLKRNDLYITNIVPWRPPQNRTPSKEEIAFFTPFIKEHIRLAKPRIVVIVGATPLTAIFGPQAQGITKTRGQWKVLTIQDSSFPCIPIFHPAYLLRQPFKKKEAWQDLLSIQEKKGLLPI